MPDESTPGFTERTITRSVEEGPLIFQGRILAQAQGERESGTRRYVLYKTADGDFVGEGTMVGRFTDAKRFEKQERAFDWFGDKALKAELLRQLAEGAPAVHPLDDPDFLCELAQRKILGGFLPANPDASWEPMAGPVDVHHPGQSPVCHLCATTIKIESSDCIPKWYWLSDISQIRESPRTDAYPKLHPRCHDIWRAVVRQLAEAQWTRP